MLAEALRLGLGGVLVVAAMAKLASPRTSRSALATFGIEGRLAQTLLFSLVIAAELVLGVGVAAGSDAAAWLAAAMTAMFAATLAAAIMRGRAGAPCACFGARSTVSGRAVVRNLVLAAALLGVPFLPDEALSTDQWLGLGLGLALVLCAALAVAVLALAREVGMLRLRLGPASALEIEEEGPALGSGLDFSTLFGAPGSAELGLAVFTSAGCHVCEGLKPAIDSLASDPRLVVASFEEETDASAWERLEIPGSPFAVVADPAGTVLAKGAFNNLAQLESLLATAERRRGAGARQEAVGA